MTFAAPCAAAQLCAEGMCVPCAGVSPWAASRFAPWLHFFRVSVMLHLAQGCQGVMNDLGLHNSGFRGGKEMNEVWLRLEQSRGVSESWHICSGRGIQQRKWRKPSVLHHFRFIRQTVLPEEAMSLLPKIWCFLSEYLSTAALCELRK